MAAEFLRTEWELALCELGLACSEAGGFAGRGSASVIVVVASVVILFCEKRIGSMRGLRYVALGGCLRGCTATDCVDCYSSIHSRVLVDIVGSRIKVVK